MKEDRLIDIIGDIDERFIDEAAPSPEKADKGNLKNKTISKWIWLAATIVITVGAGIALWLIGLNDADDAMNLADKRWPEKIIYEGESETNAEIAYIPKWDERTISEQFGEFEFNSVRYSTRVTEIADENIGSVLGITTLEGYDLYTDTTYEAKATMYEITGISSECAMALQFEGTTDYYVYENVWYRPLNLGEFIDVLNLREIVSFGKAHYKFYTSDNNYVNIEFENFDDRIVWEMLLSDVKVENVYDDREMYINVMSISVDIPILGYENVSLGVTEDGYLVTNILSSGKAFNIGKEKVQEFIDYIINNCEGYELVYIYENQNQVSENDEITEDISYIEVYTSGYNKNEE